MTMLEKMAKGMFDAQRERRAEAVRAQGMIAGPVGPAWEDAEPFEREWFLHDARASLMAIRAPDEAMRRAAEEVGRGGCGCPCCVTGDNWPAMIDAILNEGEGPE